MSNRKPVIDLSCLKAADAKFLSELSEEERTAALSGIGQGIKKECAPSYDLGDCEEVLRSKGSNAFVILGRDRPGSMLSGYGGTKDHSAASAVRITAGMGGRNPKEEDDETRELNTLSPNNQIDAATIYLSQKTDIDDENQGFSLSNGTIGNITKRSAAAMKADSIRIISRDGGIKLVAGGSRRNSQGGRIDSYPDINFIAGNDDTNLEPIVKGKRMIKAIRKIYRFMDQILETINGIVQEQNSLNIILQTHTHIVPPITLPPMPVAGSGFGAAPPGGGPVTTVVQATAIADNPVVFVGNTGISEFSPEVFSQAATTSMALMGISVDRIAKLKANLIGARNNTILPSSPNYINSKNVHTT